MWRGEPGRNGERPGEEYCRTGDNCRQGRKAENDDTGYHISINAVTLRILLNVPYKKGRIREVKIVAIHYQKVNITFGSG
jgi:hypothetical protein